MPLHHEKMQKKQARSQIQVIEVVLRRGDPVGVCPGDAAPAHGHDDDLSRIVSAVEKHLNRPDPL